MKATRFQDTVREEFTEILERIVDIKKRKNPNSALLFDSNGRSYTVQDVAIETQNLYGSPLPTRQYRVYLHNLKDGNKFIGNIDTLGVMGRIDVSYKEPTDKEVTFRIHVTFGSRVNGYAVKGSDGVTYHESHTKDTIGSLLEQKLKD